MTGYFYKHYDANDRLLYAGITNKWEKRSATHMCGAHWSGEIHRFEIYVCEDMEEAARREVDCVRNENPLYNVKRFTTPRSAEDFIRIINEKYKKKHPLVAEAIKKCGGPGAFCDALGISRQALHQWGGGLPELRRYEIMELLESLPDGPVRLRQRRRTKKQKVRV